MEVSKSDIRKTVLGYRKLLSADVYQELNSQLLSNLKAHLFNLSSPVIHTFLPITRNHEPDILPLLPELLHLRFKIMVSKTDFRSKKMTHFHLKEDSILKLSNMGIPEPVNASPASIQDAEMILIPLAVADKHGNRIGYGGGYYDQLLSKTKALKVGLSLSPLLDEIHQMDEWDKPLDLIITPKQTWQKQH